jgi:hypothetical protein
MGLVAYRKKQTGKWLPRLRPLHGHAAPPRRARSTCARPEAEWVGRGAATRAAITAKLLLDMHMVSFSNSPSVSARIDIDVQLIQERFQEADWATFDQPELQGADQ